MMFFWLTVCAAHPKLLANAKRTLVPITMNGIERSVTTVLKMIPDSINAVIPEDPWWLVRNVATPIVALFAPHYLLSLVSKIVLFYVHSHYTLVTISFVLMYFFTINVQWEFAARYIEWSAQQEKLAIAEKIMKEEQKLDEGVFERVN